MTFKFDHLRISESRNSSQRLKSLFLLRKAIWSYGVIHPRTERIAFITNVISSSSSVVDSEFELGSERIWTLISGSFCLPLLGGDG